MARAITIRTCSRGNLQEIGALGANLQVFSFSQSAELHHSSLSNLRNDI